MPDKSWFKFELGDEVIPKQGLDELRAWNEIQKELELDNFKYPLLGIVTHRIYEQCHGGCVQLTYHIQYEAKVLKLPEHCIVSGKGIKDEFRTLIREADAIRKANRNKRWKEMMERDEERLKESKTENPE